MLFLWIHVLSLTSNVSDSANIQRRNRMVQNMMAAGGASRAPAGAGEIGTGRVLMGDDDDLE